MKSHAESQLTEWLAEMESLNAKLDEAQIPDSIPTETRKSIISLFSRIVASFASLAETQRQQIIDALNNYDSLSFCAEIDADMNSEAGFRDTIILFAIRDQGRDVRDEAIVLNEYRNQGVESGFDVATIFGEVAELASNRDRFGWGSTRDLLLDFE